MPDRFLSIGPVTLQTFTWLVGAALVCFALIVILRQPTEKRAAITDVLLGGLLGGVIFARLFHVILNWAHFQFYPNEILSLSSGGLDWHGAFLGAWVGITLVSKWRGVDVEPYLDAFGLLLPLVMLVSWVGCWAASCAYGAEVATLADYPSWVVWEAPDGYGLYAPRFHTHLLGSVSATLVLCLIIGLHFRAWLPGSRLWFALVLVSLGMFVLGFLRGDYAIFIAGLRIDQVLDLGLFLLGIGKLLGKRREVNTW